MESNIVVKISKKKISKAKDLKKTLVALGAMLTDENVLENGTTMLIYDSTNLEMTLEDLKEEMNESKKGMTAEYYEGYNEEEDDTEQLVIEM